MRDKPLVFRYALGAWEMVSDLRIPFVGQGVSSEVSLIFFPLLGALCGVVCVLIGSLAGVLTNPIAGAVVFAAAATAFVLTKDSLRGVSLLGSLLFNRRRCGEFGAALKYVSPDYGLDDDPAASIVKPALAIGEFILFLLMGRYCSAWFLPFVFAGGFTVQGALAAEFGIVDDPDRTYLKVMWGVFAVIGVISFLSFQLATVIGAVAVYALAVGAAKFIRAHVDAPGADLVTLCGALAELALLLSGFFWSIRLG